MFRSSILIIGLLGFITGCQSGGQTYEKHKEITDQELTIHESISEGNNMVMIWSFKAIWAESGQESRWGGITLIRFDDSGKVVLEVGEESRPGPAGRLNPGEL